MEKEDVNLEEELALQKYLSKIKVLYAYTLTLPTHRGLIKVGDATISTNLPLKDFLRTFKGATLQKPKRMLWNAKMRFGKMLTTCSLVNDLEEKGLYDLASSLERVG